MAWKIGSMRFHTFLLILTLPAVAQLPAQHDPQRNATIDIAAGNLKAAEKELEKADADAPETHFVRMMMALKGEDTETAVAHARAALEAGLPFERLVVGPRDLLAALHETEQFQQWKKERLETLLIHGPMLGQVTGTSAAFWVRTAEPAKVRVKVGEIRSEPVETSAETDYTAVLEVTGLSPDTEYAYAVLINDEPVELEGTRFRTFPKQGEPARFTVAFGGGAGFNPRWERMWDVLLGHDPLAMLMLGDNVYIDDPEHPLTHYYCYYRRQSRPEWRRLVRGTAMYAIYDDHDFGKNDCVPGPEIEEPAWKREVWNIFRQNWNNPAYGGGPEQPGCRQDFFIGDVHFLMLDGRYYRDLKGGSMLGPVQKAWLKETLKSSPATFKIIASPVPFTPNIKPGSKDPWDGYPEEREEIFGFIEENKIPGVFLIAADRHRSDIRVIDRENGYDLVEFTSSKLTNKHTHKVVETPGLIYGYNKKPSAGLMHFDTTADIPRVTFEILNIDDESLHTHDLSLSSLQP